MANAARKSARGVGRPARLSAQGVLDAAFTLVAERGLAQLSMRALAELLGATPMALYKHVGTREELQRAVVTRCFDTLVLPDEALSVRAFLNTLANEVRRIGLRHPGVMEYLLAHGPIVEPTLRVLDRTVARLHAAGVPHAEALALHDTFFSWLAGSVARQHSAATGDGAPFAAFLDAARALPAASYPALAASLPHLVGADFAREFDYSLALMLDAVDLRVARCLG